MTREEFAAEVIRQLKTEPAPFNLRSIADRGLETGALTVAEAAAIERRNQLPVWLKQAGSLALQPPPPGALTSEVVETGHAVTVRPPRIISGQLPPAFASTRGHVPDITLTYGEDGGFYLQNFLKTGMAGGGSVPDATDPEGAWAWDIVKDREPVRLEGSTFICVVEGSAVFTHFLLDTAPRFEIARRAGVDPADFDRVLIATARSKFHTEILAAAGIDPARMVTRDKLGPHIHCDRFAMVSRPRQAFFAGDWLYDWAKRTFDAPPAAKPDKKLYISRGAATRRRLVNEPELMPILEKYGYETIAAEHLTVRQTAQLCARASHIVAPHGAGLSNLVFFPSGAKLLELYGAHISPEYWIICEQMGHDYACLQGTAEDGSAYTEEVLAAMPFFKRNAADLRIDPVLFENALAEMG